MVLNQITYYPLFGMPMIAWGGITTVVLFLITLYLGAAKKDVKLHKTMAIITTVLALGHGLLGILAQF